RGRSSKRRYPKRSSSGQCGINPPNIPWAVFRIAMSNYFHVSPIEIEERWSVDDVDYAHEALDYMDYLEWVQTRSVKK
ncbi:MAG: hypothetical protein KC505_09180, partial [Myxococcales bacterium]|nr:hypothetical protein [Myxococcales bacterium]